MAHTTSNYIEHGGARDVIGGSCDIVSGGDLDIESGASFKIAGTAIASEAAELDQRVITGELALQTAGQTYMCSPFTGNVVAVRCVVEDAITAGNGETETVLTVKDNGGNSMGTIDLTYADMSAGDVFSLAPAANQDVAAGDMIEIESDGATGDAVDGNLFVVIQIT